MAAERRRAARFAIEQMVELSYGRESFVHASGINLSRSGLLCSVDTQLEPYTQVSLLMSLPTDEGNRRINCEGMVARCDEHKGKFKAGISFTSLSPEDEAALDAYLASRPGDQKE